MDRGRAIEEITCPNCKNKTADKEAIRCLFCGESLGRSIGFMGKIRYFRPKIILAITALFVILCFFLLMK
ncbi:MAG: hypothetical protein ABIG92_04980 [Candidatus Omnitrophota bacterium]